MSQRVVTALFAALLVLGGCIGTSPEQRVEESLGPYRDGDEEHRPGQPCLACHGADFTPGEEEFMVAGTVYPYPDSGAEEGMGGVYVEITDARERVVGVTTNRTGNFMFEHSDDRERESNGKARVPFELAFPLRMRIRFGDVEQVMESVTWREGSCAYCHALGGPHEGSEPPVYLMEAP